MTLMKIEKTKEKIKMCFVVAKLLSTLQKKINKIALHLECTMKLRYYTNINKCKKKNKRAIEDGCSFVVLERTYEKI